MRIRTFTPSAVLLALVGGVVLAQVPGDNTPNKHPLVGWDPSKPIPAGFEAWYLTDKPDIVLFVERPKTGGLNVYSVGGEDRGKFVPDANGQFRDKHGMRLQLDANSGTLSSKDGKVLEKLTKGLPNGPNDRWRPARQVSQLTLPDKVGPATKRVVLDGDWKFNTLGQSKLKQTATGFTLDPAMGPTLTMTALADHPNVYRPASGMPTELWVVTGKNHIVRTSGTQVLDTGLRTSSYPVAPLPFGLVPSDRNVDLGGHWRGGGTTIYLEWTTYGYLYAGKTLTADAIWPNVYRNGADLWVPLDECLLAVVSQGQLKLYLRDATFPLHHQLTGTGGFAASRTTLDYTGTWRADSGATLTFAKQGTAWMCTDGNGALADGTLLGVQWNMKNCLRLVFSPQPPKAGNAKSGGASYHLDVVCVDPNTAIAGFDSRLAVVYRRNGPPVAAPTPTTGNPATTLYRVSVKYVGDTKPPYATRTGGPFAIIWGGATLTGDPASSFLRKAERSAFADRSDVFTCPGDAVPKPDSVLLSQREPTKVDRIEVDHRGGTTLIPCKGTLPATMTKYALQQVALVNDLNTYAEVYTRDMGKESTDPVAILPPDGSLFLPDPLPDNKSWVVRTRLDIGGKPFAVYTSDQLEAASHRIQRIALTRITGQRPRAGDSAKVRVLGLGELDWVVKSPRQIDTTKLAYTMRQVSRDLPHDLDHRRIYVLGGVQPNSPDVRPGWEVDFDQLKWVERDPDTHKILNVRDMTWSAPPPLTLAQVTGNPSKMAELRGRAAGVLKDKGKDLFPATVTYGGKSYDQLQLQDAYRKFDAEFVKSLRVSDPKTTITSFAASFNSTRDYSGTANAVFQTMITNTPGQDQKNLYLALQQFVVAGWLNDRADAMAYLDRWINMIKLSQDTASSEIQAANSYLTLSGTTGKAGDLSPVERDAARVKAVLGVADFVLGKVYPEAPSLTESLEKLETAKTDTLEVVSRARDFSFSLMATLDGYLGQVQANQRSLPKSGDQELVGLENLYLKTGDLIYDYRKRFVDARAAVEDLRQLVLKDLDLMKEVARLEADAKSIDVAVATVRAPYGNNPPVELRSYPYKLPPLTVTTLPFSQIQLRKDIWNQLLPTRLGLYSRVAKQGTGVWGVIALVSDGGNVAKRVSFTQFDNLPYPGGSVQGKNLWLPSEWLASQTPSDPDGQAFRDAVMNFTADNSKRGQLVTAYTLDIHYNSDPLLRVSTTTDVFFAWDPLLKPTDPNSSNEISALPDSILNRLTELRYTPAELRALAGDNVYVSPAFSVSFFNVVSVYDDRKCSAFQKIPGLTSSVGRGLASGPYYGPTGPRDGLLRNTTPAYTQPLLFLRN